MTTLTVAALQLAFTEDTAENIRSVSELVREAAGKGAKKGPRSPELWLKEFLFCGRCGKPMRGWFPRKDKYL